MRDDPSANTKTTINRMPTICKLMSGGKPVRWATWGVEANTGRLPLKRVRGYNKGALRAEALPVREGMRMDVEEWERVMIGYGKLCWRVAGSAANLAAAARAAGQQWFWGSGKQRGAEG